MPLEIKDLFNKYDLMRADKFNQVSFEFQQLCLENAPIFGRAIWKFPYQKGVTDVVLREAIEICKKREITTIGYLTGVIKRLKAQS